VSWISICALNFRRVYDNPFLPEDFVRGLEAEYAGTVYYQRYILGLWAKAEGLIYPMYQEAIEDAYAPEDGDPYVVSVDYGTQNAFVALKWRRSADGVWHVVDEYYYSGREEGHQKTDEDYVLDMVAFCDDAPKGRDIEIIVDPSSTSFITALRRYPDRTFRVRDADNDVANGIRDTAVCLQARRGLVKIGKNCENTMREFAGYVWADCDGNDRPIKVDDHCMDALRYFVRTKRVYRPQMGYESVVEQMGSPNRARRFEV
jgi:PBSX family phage terminase large subunit